jgi:hypothetical protein
MLDAAPPLLPDMPHASSSALLLAPNGFDYSPAPSPLSTATSTNGTNGANGTVKRKRGRPPKNPNAVAGSSTPRAGSAAPRNATANGVASKAARLPRTPAGSSSTVGVVTPVQRIISGSGTHPITPETVCSLCGGTDVHNREGGREKMVSCVKCGRSGHPTCLGITNSDVVKKMRSYEWCCIECKPCEVCLDKGEDVSFAACIDQS